MIDRGTRVTDQAIYLINSQVSRNCIGYGGSSVGDMYDLATQLQRLICRHGGTATIHGGEPEHHIIHNRLNQDFLKHNASFAHESISCYSQY